MNGEYPWSFFWKSTILIRNLDIFTLNFDVMTGYVELKIGLICWPWVHTFFMLTLPGKRGRRIDIRCWVTLYIVYLILNVFICIHLYINDQWRISLETHVALDKERIKVKASCLKINPLCRECFQNSSKCFVSNELQVHSSFHHLHSSTIHRYIRQLFR